MCASSEWNPSKKSKALHRIPFKKHPYGALANIAAIVFLTDGAKNRYRPMVVAVDGALFRYSTLLRPAISEELDTFLVQKHQRYCVCKPVPNASAVGTAAASLRWG